MHTTPPFDDDAATVARLLDAAARTGVVTADPRGRVARIGDSHQRRHRDNQHAIEIETGRRTTSASIESFAAARDQALQWLDRAEARLHATPDVQQYAALRHDVRTALAAAIDRNHLARVHANLIPAGLHLPARLGYFAVTATTPVTVRKPAVDAQDARRTAVALIADDLTGLDNVQIDLDLASRVQVTKDQTEPVNPDDEPPAGPGSQR